MLKKKMYFDIFVNEEKPGTFGHDDLENFNIPVSGSPKDPYVFAGVICREGEKLFHNY